MPPKITLHPKGFKAFAAVQGSAPPANRGVDQDPDGKWRGWQRHPQYMTAPYATRAEAKEALLRDAPEERQ